LPAFSPHVALNNSYRCIRRSGIIGIQEEKALIFTDGTEIFLLGEEIVGEAITCSAERSIEGLVGCPLAGMVNSKNPVNTKCIINNLIRMV
jgi:hypothetical protein